MATNTIDFTLSEQQRRQLDGIVGKLTSQGQTHEQIQSAVDDFKRANGSPKFISSTATSQSAADIQSAQQTGAFMPANTVNPSLSEKLGINAAANLLPSAFNAIKGVGTVAKNFLQYGNPVATTLNIGQDKNPVAQIGKVIGGAGVRAGQAIGAVNPEIQTPEFDSLVNGLKDQFGSLEALQRTATNDPVGFATTVLATLQGGGSLLGKGEQVANAIEGLGKTSTELAGNVAKAPFKAGAGVAKSALTPIADFVNPSGKISSQMETILNETPIDKFNKYVSVLQENKFDPRKMNPLDYAGQVASEAANSLKGKLTELGQQKNVIVKDLANTNVSNLVNESYKNFQQLLKDRVGGTINKLGDVRPLKDRMLKIDTADRTLLKDINTAYQDLIKNPSFMRSDDFIDKIQGILYKAKNNALIPVNKNVEGLAKSLIGELNGKLKEVGGSEYTRINGELSNIKGTFSDLNKALGTGGKKGANLMKKVFSSTDAGTKKLFADIQKTTGVDLTQEASLAKFVMEHLGTPEQKGFLTSILDLSKGGLLTKGVKFMSEKLQNPMQRAKDIIIKNPVKK